jgi:hypothetical protein
MKKILFVILIMLILAACTSMEPPPTLTEVPPTDTKAPPTMTPLPPTPDLTADWQIYRNEKYGYSFKYPPDCFYGPMPGDCKEKPPEERRPECLCFLNGENPDEVSLEKMIIEADTVSGAPFHISHYDTPVYNPPPGIDLITWIKETYYSNYEDIPDEQNMELGGIPAVKFYTPKSPMAPSQEEIFFIKEDKLFRIYMIEVENENNRELYDQLLSSFSFEE